MPSILDSILSEQSAQSAIAELVGDTTIVEALEESEAKSKKAPPVEFGADNVFEQKCTPTLDINNNLFSNKVHLIQKDVYLPQDYKPIYQNIDFKKPFSYNNEVDDNLRFASQKYWYNNLKTNFKFAKSNNFLPTEEVPFEMRISEPNIIETDSIPILEQSVHLLPKRDAFTRDDAQTFDRNMWYTYINGGKINLDSYEQLVELNKTFTDLSFDHFIPVEDEISILAKKASVNVNYNFHIRQYERVASERSLPEYILPNVYAMVAHLENLAGNTHVASLNKLDNLLADVLVPKENKPLTFRDNSQYFDEWARNVGNTSEPWRSQMERRFKDIIFQMEELEKGLLETAKNRSNIYPASIQVDFTTDSTTEFTQILKDSLLDKAFTSALIRDLIADREGHPNSITRDEFAICNCFQDISPIVDNRGLRTWDVTKWWVELEKHFQSQINLPQSNLITDPTLDIKKGPSFGAIAAITQNQNQLGQDAANSLAISPSILEPLNISDFGTFLDAFKDLKSEENLDPFYGQLLRIIFAGKIRKFIKNHMRDYCSMMSGLDSYAEPVLYRISKHAVLPNGKMIETPIQNYYFPNSNEIDTISFVDTQVKYGKSYVYKIWSYYIAVGNKYVYYTDNSSGNGKTKGAAGFISLDKNDTASIKIRSSPTLTITEVVQQTFEPVKLMDDPPLPPSVEFIPYIGEDKKIAISLCNSIGEQRLLPVAIEVDDLAEIDGILKKQKSKDGKIRYAGDDSVDRFEIFRITNHPSSYSDYRNSKIAIVSTEMPSNPVQRTPEVTFIDSLLPNVKYYYIFRAIDVHKHLSNPTQVYEIELVNNSGAIYPLIRVVDFLKKEEKYPTKEFKKYLRINVAQPQKTINLEKSALRGVNKPISKAPSNIVLGIEEESVWEKKFKIRITSKTSGKKIDINFKVDRKVNEFKATDVNLEDIVVDNPNSIADILYALANNK